VSAIVVSPGETVTCTFVNEKLATIILVKNTIGGNDTFDFVMTGSGLPSGTQLTTVGNTASTTFSNLDPDNTYSIAETPVPVGWDLISSSCTGTNTPGSITPDAGEVITCTFTNQADAFIIVDKVTDPTGDLTLFDFTTDYGSPFSLADGDTPNNSGDLAPGVYDVTEAAESGWDPTGVSCVSSLGDPTDTDGQDLDLDAGETITCTFTNQADAFIIVDKVTDPTGDLTLFDFTTSYGSPFTLADASTPNNSGDLAPGTYSVTEAAEAGWDPTGVSCVSSLGGFESAGAIALTAGETVTCTFTNTKRGSISGFKWHDSDANGSFDGSEVKLDGWTIFIDLDNDQTLDGGETSVSTSGGGNYTLPNLVPGTYSVCEVIQAGWSQTYPFLTTSSLCHSVIVGAGQNVTGKNFGNILEREGTIGLWRNWDKHNIYTQSAIDGWLGGIDSGSWPSGSSWLMTDQNVALGTGSYPATTTGMVALIKDSTGCKGSERQCSARKFLAQYLALRLDLASGRKSLSNSYSVAAFPAGAASYLGLVGPTATLGGVIAAIETKATTPTVTTLVPTRAQLLLMMGVADYINNQGI